MLRRLFILLPLVVCFAYAARGALTTVTLTVAPGTAAPQRVAFTALHTYYMSPTGSDRNSGTSPSSAWATPNHSVDCGDVIIAAPGAYSSNGITVSSTPSNCPSSSGGIDGTGGIYFAVVLCNGNVGTCHVTDSNNSSNGAIQVEASNWAFEGWQVSSANLGTSGSRGFQVEACGSGTERIGYSAFVNDIATHANDGFNTGDCDLNQNVPGNGVDYFAVVGSIAQNANSDSICLAAIDDVGPANLNTNAGVHVFVGGNFATSNLQAQPGCTGSDGEAIMFDTWDAHGYVGTGVIENNIVYHSSWAGLQVFMQHYNSSAPEIQIFNNTFFDNNVCTQFDAGTQGDMNFELDDGFPWIVNVYNNISRSVPAVAGCNGAGPVYAMMVGGDNGVGSTVFTAGGSGDQNVFKSNATRCYDNCDSGNNVRAGNGFSYGTNTYEDPGFANTTDLLANHLGAPNCSSSYTNVTGCLGWDYSTQSAAADSVIGDLVASAAGTSGKGYQPPGTCKPDPYYPTWLKGVVYLQWDGMNLWEDNGLVQKPCGL